MNRAFLLAALVTSASVAQAKPPTRSATADPPRHTAAPAPKRMVADGDSLGVVAFSRGSTQLGDAALDKVEDIAAWQADHPDSILMIDGYASRGGSSSRNLRITQQRTEAVRDALVEAGADAGRLVLVAHGADRGTQTRAGDRVLVRASVGVPDLALAQYDRARDNGTRVARRTTNDTRSAGGAARRGPGGGGAGSATNGAGSATSGSNAPTGAGSGNTTIVIVPGGETPGSGAGSGSSR